MVIFEELGRGMHNQQVCRINIKKRESMTCLLMVPNQCLVQRRLEVQELLAQLP